MDLQAQIDKLTDQLAHKKAQQYLRDQAQRKREEKRSRASRNRHIFKLGGIVEKMGLDGLDEPLLIGLLEKDYKRLQITTPANIEELRSAGRQYPDKKRLQRLELPKPDAQ